MRACKNDGKNIDLHISPVEIVDVFDVAEQALNVVS